MPNDLWVWHKTVNHEEQCYEWTMYSPIEHIVLRVEVLEEPRIPPIKIDKTLKSLENRLRERYEKAQTKCRPNSSPADPASTTTP